MLEADKKIRQEGMCSSFKNLYGKKKTSEKSSRVYFKVALDLPEDVSISDMKEYIEDSVQSNVGCKDPSCDPLFYLDRKTVKVTRILKRK